MTSDGPILAEAHLSVSYACPFVEQKLADRARQLAADALTDLAGDIEAGRSQALTRYLAAMGRFRRQSWNNVILITAQRPEATQVASLRAWRAVGRFVTKSEKGIVILAPADPSRSSVRANYIYDVSQTKGKPIPERTHAAASVWEYGEHLRALAAKRGIAIRVDRSIEPARGVSEGGTIRLRPGLSPSEYVSVLSHELAHEMLHHRPEAATLSRDAIEAQAYGVAYVVARRLGLETDATVAEFMVSFCRDTEALTQTLAAIQRTSAQILDELVPQPPRAVGPGAVSDPHRGASVEPEDFERLQREYGNRLIESLAGFVRDRHRAEDLAARAFEKAWENREGFRGEASLRTWIEAIGRNEARRDWSQARHVQVGSLDGTLARDWPAPELVTDELEKREDDRRLKEALAKLPTKPRRALVAHFVEGLSIRDIARRERVPEGTVLSRIFTGKQLLREAWAAEIARPAPKTTAERPKARNP